MKKTSPREVLLKQGKWMGSTDFIKLVASKDDISERWAKKLIADAYNSGGIKKHVFPDRTVIYGLTEFGPPTSLPPVHVPYPRMSFEITQRVYDKEKGGYYPPNIQRRFPSVGFNIWNCNDYPVRVKVKIRMILGGRDLGLIPDSKGYYTGETELPFDPKPSGMVNGNFSVTEECAKSGEELTLQVSVIAIDPDNIGHRLSTKSWTYVRKENSWFYEPRVFVEEQWPNLRLG